MSHLLALDQGTTSSRAIVFSPEGRIVSVAQAEFAQHYPQPGWVEHDPTHLWTTQRDTARQAINSAGLGAADLAAIGITNQRETTLIWDRRTGKAIAPAIVWQDRRTADWCDRLRKDGLADKVQARTGLVVDAYFSASKICWLLENVPGARAGAEAGHLAFGTVDSWLLWRLTGGAVHATDVTNASRTMLFNLAEGQWDEWLLDKFDIPAAILPEVRPSAGHFGEATADFLGASVPIAGVAGDQQAALFGQACFDRGMVKSTYGTGCFILMNVGDAPATSRHQLLSTAAWQLPGGESTYALEGSVFIGGAVVQWLRDGLKIIKRARDVEALAATVPDSGGVYLVPAFAGLGAPHWDQYARGTIVGLTRGTTDAHLARAALDGIALQVADIVRIMAEDSGIAVNGLRVDGGAAANGLLLQTQADLLQIPVVRPKIIETTALGAAYFAGLGVGLYKSIDDIRGHWAVDRVFEPKMPPAQAQEATAGWQRALDRARDWEQPSR